MSEDHNIDRLFQERFKDFEVDAPKNSWDNIEKQLTEKSKKPIIPLWQKLSGVAAIVGVLILIGSQWLINPVNINPNNSVVDSPEDNFNNNNQNQQLNDFIISNPSLIDETTNTTSSSSDNQNLSNDNTIVSSENYSQQSISQKASKNFIPQRKSGSNAKSTKQTIAILSGNDEYLAATLALNSKSAILKNVLNISVDNIENKSKFINTPKKKSLIEVAENINNEKEIEIKSSDKSWFIKPQVSPVFYGNLGSGNSVDSNFSENSGQGEVNVSYGVNIAYKLNDKIKIRTGVNRVNLNYTTNDLFVVQGQELSALSNVNTSSSFNSSVLTSQQIENFSSNGALSRTETLESQLQQELGYIEIPMEIEYKLINRKIDVNIIGGASTLLLNNNNLEIQNLNGTTSIGEANNINNLSFSTNFAIGLDYDISRKLMFNLEPTFKYQINTFQAGTTDFRPYFLGIYSGIIFKF